jgi:NAD(P) transhydrogenase subunit alpha
VRIFGPLNLPAEMPVHASQMYARTVAAMIGEFVKDGAFLTDFDDEIFKGACVTHGGQVVNDRVRALLEKAAAPAPA